MRPRVKICGITNLEDALLAAQAGADALGFIFYEKSPRSITAENAAIIIRQLPPFITPVGVFVNADREFIDTTIERTGIRAIQLSGDESPAECNGYPVSVIKSFRIRRGEEVEAVRHFTISAAMLDGAKDGQYGGSGTVPDFTIAAEIRKFHPLILAGGLNPENIVEAVHATRPYAVDVNSGIETRPGKKDPAMLRLLFQRLGSLPPHKS